MDTPRWFTAARKRETALVVSVAAAVTALDLWSKSRAMAALSTAVPHPGPVCHAVAGLPFEPPQRWSTHVVELVKGVFELRYTENCSAAFSLLQGVSEAFRKPLLMGVAIAGLVLIVGVYRSAAASSGVVRAGISLLVGGALGNFIDRIRFGYVVDFMRLHWGTRFSWPVFNVADVAIVVGLGLMALTWTRRRSELLRA